MPLERYESLGMEEAVRNLTNEGSMSDNPFMDNQAAMPILESLRRHIRDQRSEEWSDLAIDDMCLDSLFLSVRLTDGSVGVAMNYDLEGHTTVTRQQVEATRSHLLGMLGQQPLFWDLLGESTESLAQTALSVAVLSALSSTLLKDVDRLQKLGLDSREGRVALSRFQGGGASEITVLGFGGYLEEALKQDWVKRVNCCDYLANDEGFQKRNPHPFLIAQEAREHMDVVYDDGSKCLELLERAHIVCLSASTLCNGTLGELLTHLCDKGKVVILEGPSGGVLPGPLFERGVTHLVHNPVDVDFVHLSHRFSRQTHQGLQRINSGRFIDIILPEQRTVTNESGLALEGTSFRDNP